MLLYAGGMRSMVNQHFKIVAPILETYALRFLLFRGASGSSVSAASSGSSFAAGAGLALAFLAGALGFTVLGGLTALAGGGKLHMGLTILQLKVYAWHVVKVQLTLHAA